MNNTSSSRTPKEGDLIGPYRLIQKIGEGDYAHVWRARQEEPLPRDVALKILKPGMGSAEVLRRFQSEVELLTQLNHPGIACALDAGHTPEGKPYLVVELVPDALPVTEWVKAELPTLRERLSLFLQICHAMRHAHQKGVIHRDLKPGNVLVTAGVVKVIDFGIARPLSSESGSHEILGTPGYMSPEQQSGADEGDTRSDVYALGSLLSGMTQDCSNKDIAHIIGRCGEEKPARRYQSVAALAEDVENLLSSRPITARGHSLAYVAGHAMRRHWISISAGAAALLFLVASAFISMDKAQEARAQKRRADAAVVALVGMWENQVGYDRKGYGITTVLNDMNQHLRHRKFDAHPELRARIAIFVSRASGVQADYHLGISAAELALHTIQQHPGSTTLGMKIDALTSLGNCLSYSGKTEAALPHLHEAWRLMMEKVGPDSVKTLPVRRALGSGLAKAGKPEAITVLQEMLALAVRHQLPETDDDVLRARGDLASALLHAGEDKRALSELDQAFRSARGITGPKGRDLAVRLLLRRGSLLGKLNRDEEGVATYLEAEKIADQGSDPDPSIIFMLRFNRCQALMRMNRAAEARDVLERLFEDQVRHFGIRNINPQKTALTLARSYVALSQWNKLEVLVDQMLENMKDKPGGYPYHNPHIEALAMHYQAAGEAAKADAWRQRAAVETKKHKAYQTKTAP